MIRTLAKAKSFFTPSRSMFCPNLYWVSCLVLHPVTYPNKGPVVEQYLAQEAIGLAKSLNWNIVQGPFWGKQIEADPQAQNEPILQQFVLNKKAKKQQKQRPLRDGDYVYSQFMGRGTYYRGGIIYDPNQSQSDGDLYNQWKNKLLRTSLANRSLVKTRRITQKLFFTRGKAQTLGDFIASQPIDCVFVNAEMTPGQVRNLKKLFEAKMNDVQQPRGYNAENNESETEFESETEEERKEKAVRKEKWKTIKIFDRFSIILQIFAKRAKTPVSKLQIQLNFLKYIKTRLVRAQGSTYSSTHNLFSGDLMRAQQVNLEIVSAKQRRAHASMSGSGESQLEIETRNVRDRQAKIRKDLEEQKRLRDEAMRKKKERDDGVPVVALVGYTNAGKSATMNCLLRKKVVESQDLLFQTLSTTAREVVLPSGNRIRLLDTIGFISHLPHELVESFKITLQQVRNADIVLHIIDISHPHHILQKQTVLKVLQQLGFEESFYRERMVEVWNKVDLVEDKSALEQPGQAILLSALKGTGMKKLMQKVETLGNKIMNKAVYKFKYPVKDHFKRLNWLKENANIPHMLNEVYDYQTTPEGTVEYSLTLDGPTYGKYLKFIDDDSVVRKTKKGMPPPGWANDNKKE